MKHSLCLVAVAGLALSTCAALSACAPNLQALASDPATLSLHQQVSAPGWTITTDWSRSNSTNTAASASGNGASVNVAPNSTVNPAPVRPTVGTTLTPGAPTAATGP